MKTKTDSILDNLYIAAPCAISWESMKGDDRQRSCSGCSRTVYNISDMTKREAEEFLSKNGTNECMKFFRRADGTIMTDNCPRALRKIRDRCKAIGRVAAALVALIVSAPVAWAQGKPSDQPVRAEWNARRLREMSGGPYYEGRPNGGGIMISPGLIAPVRPTITTTTTTTPPVTTTIESTLLTKEETLPNGTKVILVVPNGTGKIIEIRSLPIPAVNENVDTRALDFLTKAQKSRAENNIAMAEFYLEKALDACEKQKNGDARFREFLESELKNIRSQSQIEKSEPAKSEENPEENAKPEGEAAHAESLIEQPL